MAFNELNSVEHYIVNQLCGVNLKSDAVNEPKPGYGTEWVYKYGVQAINGEFKFIPRFNSIPKAYSYKAVSLSIDKLIVPEEMTAAPFGFLRSTTNFRVWDWWE